MSRTHVMGQSSLQAKAQIVYDPSATMRAWENLLSGQHDDDEPPPIEVRPEIYESWSRSRSEGVDANAARAPLPDHDEGLRERLDRNSDLLEAAAEALESLGRLLEGAEAMLLLCDASGVVIRSIGDARTRHAGREIHLDVGGIWDEAQIGTNGIGTAIRTGQPTFVHEAEHFCVGIKGWTCAAAPIRDPLGDSILGVIDLSGPVHIFRPHNLALVAAAAREIEGRLAERHKQERESLLAAFIDVGASRRADDGLVILDRIGRIVYSRNTPPELGNLRPDPLRVGRTLVDLNSCASDMQIAAALPMELRPNGISRLILNGTQRGVVLHLPRPKPVGPGTPLAAQISPRSGTAEPPLPVIGTSDAFLEAIEMTRHAAEARASVLIQGETGVGKELFARLIHTVSGRGAEMPFVTMNCGAISVELVASELFGHVAGAFTGAMRDGRAGQFELANGGVLCLDEIGEMPLDIQPYLLRVLEQRAVYRVGDSKRRPVDVQVVAMTNRDLQVDVGTGKFRRDLYYRISTITIEVPPLRNRPGDVPLLVDHYNAVAARRLGRAPLRISDGAMALLEAYAWPGNVRELRNLCDRLNILMRGGDVGEQDLPPEFRRAADTPTSAKGARDERPSAELNLDAVEESAIRRAFAAENGNVTRVAAVLGVSRPTLYRKMRQYGIRRVYE